MILIGMFDSPFVRRVAVSMELLGLPFEHRNWSVGKDQQRIREFNPAGRVPTLVLDDGEALIESAMILDHLDELVGPDRALMPPAGAARRRARGLIALATGAMDKGVQQIYERIFRPAEKRHPPWVQRCNEQMHGALRVLDQRCATADGEWLIGDAITQADVTLACYLTYLAEAVPVTLADYPALQAHTSRCEALPAFRKYYVAFDPPDAGAKP